ncbi:MAG TPA: polysaccharide deacetylase family protein, partial [Parafilimonas sp.]|nr:polysaccharide deacetylase family protein [Parafilimonas sp.]
GIYFFANGLLHEANIREPELSMGVCNETQVLFAHHNANSLLNFDVFAAIFYVLSRYEEYFSSERDVHGNYDYKNSVLHKLNILQTPVVEQWILILKVALQKTFPSLQFKQNTARYLLSFDIDVAYAYKNRNLPRTAGGFFKKIFSLNFTDFKDQLLTIFDRKQDMFDTYEYIFSCIKSMPAIFFFNMGNYGRYDKNPSYKNSFFRKLISSINQKYMVGLHPSFASNKIPKLIGREKKKLEEITGKEITASRQHYLKVRLPQTYHNLIQKRIDKDFTMGYYYTYGFRAGTCNSFLFFDLMKNETTNLRLYPFVFMEGTLNDIMKMNIQEAKQVITKLVDVIKEYHGLFIPLWHNSTLSNIDEWKGWREVFEHMISELHKKEFESITLQ